MPKISIESHPIPFDALGLDHLYLVYDPDGVADANDRIIRGGPDSIIDDITLEIDLNIEVSTDARGSDTPEDRGSLEITDEQAGDAWSIMMQVARQIEAANISYNGSHNSNSVVTTLLHSIGFNVEAYIPSNTIWDDLPGAETVLGFARNITGTGNGNFISGWAQNDTIDGGAGNDTLKGASGDDSLVGGNGTDELDGGTGSDIYIMRFGETGIDEITDSDGTGEVRINGLGLTGTAAYNDGSSSWTMGHYTLTRTGTADADLTFTSGFAGDPSFVIKNFTSGDLGITLATPEESPANPAAPSGGPGELAGEFTPGPTTYVGTSGDDGIEFWYPVTVSGGAGNDEIYMRGNGRAEGDAGDDTIYGGDYALGGDGNDVLEGATYQGGGNGDDYLHGGGRAGVSGGDGNDTISAGGFNAATSIFGDAGNDEIGLNTLDYAVSIYGGLGADSIVITGSNAHVEGGDGDDFIGTITGTDDDNYLNGGDGNDTISVDADWSANTLIGGAGFDTYISYGNIDVSVEPEGSQVNADQTSTITGGSGNDIFYGSSSGDTLIGAGGADYLSGGGGADSIVGGSGRNAMFGGVGNDTMVGGTDADSIAGGADNDAITGDAGDDIIFGGNGLDSIWGGADNDFISGENGNDSLIGEAGADTLEGGDGLDSLYGGNEADSISGGAGDDYIEGGDGDDMILGGVGSDYIDGGNGSDTVSYISSTAWVNVDLSINNHWNGDAAWDNIANVENIIGSDYADQLTGTTGVNVLSGGLSNDTITGLAGNDTIYGNAGNDRLIAGDNDDLIIGGAGSDYIDGGNGIDTVSYSDSAAWVNVDLGANNHWNGDAAWDNITNVENIIGSMYGDQLTGNTAANQLNGSLGNDTLTGGSGNDVFYFSGSHGADTINDFQGVGATVGDIIQISGSSYGALSFAQSGANAIITTATGTITLIGVNSTLLTAADFSFAA